jgi:hypothetical protein
LTSTYVVDMMTCMESMGELHETVLRAVAGERRMDADQVLAALALLRRLREQLTGWEPELIAAARELGTSWAELAPVLGVASRQAAERRYLRLRTSESGETTADGRVRAERDRRAGERAVSDWARQNSASLRRLAGQVGALSELERAAQHQVDLVQDALGEADASSLLRPLATAEPHLRATHPELAQRISGISGEADRVRRDSRDRRRG